MSKIKRIIEIEEKDYDQICEVVNETESSLGITPFAGSIIAQSKPYDDSGDLISRSALKDTFSKWDDLKFIPVMREKVLKLIDNAPTVETERPQGEWEYKPIWDNVHKSRTCNKCGYCEVVFPNEADNFCPNCGAKMKGGAE